MKKKGFTLIELLVVIAIIALLLSIVMPSLRMAKNHARRITCSSNLKSLSMAARFFADDTDGYTPCSSNVWTVNSVARAGWCGVTGTATSVFPGNQQIEGTGSAHTGLRNGQLWPYIQTPNAWGCPADPLKESLRSYGMSAQFWGKATVDASNKFSRDGDRVYCDPATAGKVINKISKLKNTGQRFLFVDNAGYNYDAYAALWYSQPKWWNLPNVFHSGSSVNGFADGHVEGYKFDADTVRVVKEEIEKIMSIGGSYKMPQDLDYTKNEDLKYYQMATWGSIPW
ncbi:MAG: type II secretion system protein [Planctomycetes bacterium]|nr:type II secretion system protein [Planctomycetota bacterium]